MSFLKKISNLFSSSADHDQNAYWIFVKCNRCGEKIEARVDLRNDLSLEYGANEKKNYYYCRKVLMGQELCFQQVEVHLKFNANRELIDRDISGGEFINEAEFFGEKEE